MDQVVEQLAHSASPSPAAAGASTTTTSASGGGAASGRSSVAAAARTDVSAPCVGLDESRAVIGSSVLGRGSFADVRSGTYRFRAQGQATDVAYKIFRGGQNLSASMRETIEKEVAVGVRLHHPCLVRMIGIIHSIQHGPCLVLELCQGGSLRAALDRARDGELSLPWKLRVQWLEQIARGMAELHSLLPSSIIHRDLKAANVLLSSADLPRAVAKVADFGVATFVQTVWSSSSGGGRKGTLAWMAPETFDGQYSEKSDVFAFAVLTFEVLSFQLPFAGKSVPEITQLVMEKFKINRALERRGITAHEQRQDWITDNPLRDRRPDLSQAQPGCPQGLADMTERCWDDSPDARPTFADCIRDLTRIQSSAAECSEISDDDARAFWTEYFSGQSGVPWNAFAAVLARQFGLSPVQLVRIRRIDRAEDEVLSQSEFDTFTRARGLQGALSDMLATKCVICMQEVVNLEMGVFCQRTLDGSRTVSRDPHFMCQDCLSGHVRNACENGGLIEERDGSPAGRIPCCLFPQNCDDGALSEGRVLAAVSDEARDTFKTALGRLAVDQHVREESERRRVEEEHARQTDAEDKARLCVGDALTVGQSVRCPGCGNPKRKDDACMHMTCDCGVHFCYVCGADRYPGVRGTGAGYRAENRVNCGCDRPSSYLQLQPGWSGWEIPGRSESPAQGALYEFHRRRMAYFVGVVKRAIGPGVWGRLRTRFPDLLQDVLEGRSIQWDEVDAAEHPKFGSRVDLPLVQEEEQQLLLRIRAQMGNASTGT